MSAPTTDREHRFTATIREGAESMGVDVREAYALGVVTGAVRELARVHPPCDDVLCPTCAAISVTQAALQVSVHTCTPDSVAGCTPCDIDEDTRMRRREDV